MVKKQKKIHKHTERKKKTGPRADADAFPGGNLGRLVSEGRRHPNDRER